MAKRSSMQKLKTIGLITDLDASLKSPTQKPRDKHQSRLQFDAMPNRVEPCLALLKARPPTGPDWLFEVKWDGYRLAVHVERQGIRIITRGWHDWTRYFPSIVEAAQALGPAMPPNLAFHS